MYIYIERDFVSNSNNFIKQVLSVMLIFLIITIFVFFKFNHTIIQQSVF